jgi:outer membrane lipoprotein-sorting protein
MLKSKISKCLLIVLCLFVTVNVFAVTWDELKVKIEAKYKGFSTEIKDMELVMVSETKDMEETGPVEVKMFTKGEKYRMETKMEMPEGSGMPAGMGDMENVVIFDGKDAWTINQFTGKQKLPTDATTTPKSQMTWWENLPVNGKVIGSEKIGDKDCYIVEVWNEEKKNDKMKGWLDKTSLLLIQMEFKGEDGKTFKTVSSNFKKVKEWEMPYTTEVFAGGKLMSKTTIKTLEINKGLSDDLFDASKVKTEGQGMPGMPNIQDMMKKFKP